VPEEGRWVAGWSGRFAGPASSCGRVGGDSPCAAVGQQHSRALGLRWPGGRREGGGNGVDPVAAPAVGPGVPGSGAAVAGSGRAGPGVPRAGLGQPHAGAIAVVEHAGKRWGQEAEQGDQVDWASEDRWEWNHGPGRGVAWVVVFLLPYHPFVEDATW